ncbi:hypothetical protein AeRB84_004326, partial [Aphanomyces euteiches]
MKNLTLQERQSVINHLLLNVKDPSMKLKPGAIRDVAAKFGVTAKTISRIWRRADIDVNCGRVLCSDVSSRRTGNVGRKLKWLDVAGRIKKISFNRRTSLTKTAKAQQMPYKTLQCYFKRANKLAPVKWALDHVRNRGGLYIDDMMDVVHIDEKWFFMTKLKTNYYLAPDEEPPHRTERSKQHITKVMFMVAVARPRWDEATQTWFDGKIGVWPFVIEVPAGEVHQQGNIQGHASHQSYTSNQKKVATWIYKKRVILQDNARPHVAAFDDDVSAACTDSEWNMIVRNQPPNSPDMNVLDLGFFRAIQSLQENCHSHYMMEIIDAVNSAWRDVEARALNNNFFTLQACLQEVLRIEGDNKYKIPHMRKSSLLACGMLPEVLPCDATEFNRCCDLLDGVDIEERFQVLAEEVKNDLDMSEICTALEGIGVGGLDMESCGEDVDEVESDGENLEFIPRILGL